MTAPTYAAGQPCQRCLERSIAAGMPPEPAACYGRDGRCRCCGHPDPRGPFQLAADAMADRGGPSLFAAPPPT